MNRRHQLDAMFSRRTLLRGAVGASLTGLLAACGSDDEEADAPTATSTTSATATSQPASAAPTESSDQPSDTRRVQHAMDVTEVPTNPQRVVVLEEGPLNSALALGITPIGAVTAFDGADFPAYLGDQTAGIQNVGTILEPDLEAVAALQPDLILSIKSRHEEIYPQLSQIAPTVFTETFRCCWRANFLKDAEALGKPEEGERIINDYLQRLEEFKAQMGDRLTETNVSVVRFVPPSDVYLYLKSSYIGTILADAGLPRPPSQDVDDFVLQVSEEQIREMEGDVIFVTTYGPPDETLLEQFRDNPLWEQLEAVQQGNVYVTPDEYWMVGIGIIAANKVVDDLFTYLLDGEAETDSPSAFPVTIEHKFGSTEISGEPQRVVTIGFSEQDPVLALGVKPVAVREWFGEQPFAIWPWAQDELGSAEPQVLTMTFGELDFEAIAALQPDLLVATHSGILDEEYQTLSRIAPTLAQVADFPDFGMPWQEQTRVIGRALGREQQAEELIAGVEKQIADAAASHSEFAGATIAWASPTGDGQYSAVGPTTPPMRFLNALGFELPADLSETIGDQESVQISSEQMTILDTNVLISQVATPQDREAVLSDPLYQQLSVASEGRTIFFVGLTDPLYGALSFSTVLSLPFAVDNLVPMLAAAVDGDPDTEVNG